MTDNQFRKSLKVWVMQNPSSEQLDEIILFSSHSLMYNNA